MSIQNQHDIPPEPIRRENLRRIIAYIDAHVGEQITLDDLVRQTECSKYYFARVFRIVMGFTPMRFVKMRRVEAAKRMMQKGDSSLAVIAVDCGFASQSHFTTAFRNVTGMTPSAWRPLTASLFRAGWCGGAIWSSWRCWCDCPHARDDEPPGK